MDASSDNPALYLLKKVKNAFCGIYFFNFIKKCIFARYLNGGIAQLARAFDWQSRGQGFDSPCLHKSS